LCTGAGVVVEQVLTCATVKAWLICTIINIRITLFPSVTRLTGAQEIADEVGARGVVDARVGIALVNFWSK